jgi:oligopeptide/dipeptide ABC transporter ATP-binding protein
MDKLLEIKNLKTYFIMKNETVKAVDGVSFEVYQGETFGLVGESGCGKSQTCRSILKLIKSPGKIVDGEILYKGKDIVPLNSKEMRKIRGSEISIIFQEPMTSLNPVLKIKKQIMEAYDNTNLSRDEKLKKSIELLRLVGIPSPEDRIEEYTHQFSGGMRQRAMIAIALASSPNLLIADEPTTALDVTIQDQIMELLNELKEELKMSMILVTHDLAVVAQMCDRIAVMYAGMIVELTDTIELFSKPRHPYTYELMKSLPSKELKGKRLEPIEGAPPNLSNLPEGCPFYPRCRYAEKVCTEIRPELEEVRPGHLARCHFPEKTKLFKGTIKTPVEKGEDNEK